MPEDALDCKEYTYDLNQGKQLIETKIFSPQTSQQ
jgi:hypothetical protein